MTDALPIRIAALYHFTRFPDPHALKPALLELCEAGEVKGTILLAGEGINGTIAGSDAAVEAVLQHIRALPGCAALEHKESRAEKMPFLRLKVRIKREIVTMGQADLDFVDGVGTYVDPHDWNALISDPDTIVIDTRNDYEVGIGTFKGAIDPATESFSEFPEWFRERREQLDASKVAPKIAMFCTGGIRCEKATAFLKAEGVEEVYHLKGGILKYLENVPAEESQWEGDCFVFDERVSVKHGLERGDYTLCRACRMPLDAQQRASEHYEEGVACEHCYAERTPEQRERYAERHKQSALARKRGEAHVGAKMPERTATEKDGFDQMGEHDYPGFEGKFRD